MTSIPRHLSCWSRRLVEFDGTVLLVSHDRAFLNNIVTSTIVFEDQTVREYDGGYDDWQRARQTRQAEASAQKTAAAAKKEARVRSDGQRPTERMTASEG